MMCPESYHLEHHAGEPNHGDVCRSNGAGNAVVCPRCCRVIKTGPPYCGNATAAAAPCRATHLSACTRSADGNANLLSMAHPSSALLAADAGIPTLARGAHIETNVDKAARTMHTFYHPFEKSTDNTKDLRIMSSWASSWAGVGYSARMLTLVDARRHPLFEKVSQRIDKLDEANAFGGER